MSMKRQGKYTRKIGRIRQTRRGVKRRFNWFRTLSRKQKILVIVAPVLAFLIITPLVTYAMYANDIADQERLMNRNNTGIVLKDRNNKPFYTIGRAEHNALSPSKDLGTYTAKALVATEDKDFYNHSGFSPLSIARAVLTNLSAGSINAYGGSTLTQQLAKNTLFSEEKSFLRKYQELAMSIAIEQRYSKDQIIDMYLNSAYFGENSFGMEDAARAYFNKTPKDLTLAESAMIIGLLPAPSAYSPISGNPEYARQRQTKVLSRMVAEKYITEEQKTAALAEQLTYAEGAKGIQNSTAPHFTDMVIAELSQKYGYEKVMRSGYQVKTALDITMQNSLKSNIEKQMPYISRNRGSNSAGIIIDPKTGEVRALVGSADWNNESWGRVNVVTAARQPGSSMKPIYYAGALADGVITPATVLHDKETDFGGYKPQNADRKFRGDVSVRSALSQSLNIPAIEVMQKYSISKSTQIARTLGLSTIDPNKDYDLTLALGSGETKLIEMANAYAGFAHGGQQYPTSLVKQINDKFNKRIFNSTSQKPKTVISPEGAYLISNILSDNSARAPIFGGSLSVSGHTVAVKTGTTNDNKDAWTLGYTPSYVVGVWAGNNDNTPMYSGGSDMAGPIWRNTMRDILSGTPDEKFVVPNGIVQRNVCRSNGGLADYTGDGVYSEFFKSSALPTEKCEKKEEPKLIVCQLDTKQMVEILEKDFDSAKYSRDPKDCQVTIQVCDSATNTVVSIDEKDFDSTKYSRDTTGCNNTTGTTQTIQACDTTTGKVVVIPQSQLDGVRYTSNTTACKKSP